MQGNLMVEDEDQLLFFANGMIVDLSSYGVISFDSSGQVMITLTYVKKIIATKYILNNNRHYHFYCLVQGIDLVKNIEYQG